MCIGNYTTRKCDGQNITGSQSVVTNNPRPLTLFNSTEIHNRSTYGTVIPWVSKPQHLDRHVVPIPHTCTPVAHDVKHTTVFWTILFPPIPKCRNKRAWYDTLLGGTGTGLGVLNTIDKQVIANKLSNVGRYSHDALQKLGRWMPSGIYSQQYQAYWDVVSARILKHSINDFRWNNVSEWLNWTECNLNMLSAKMQLRNVQQTVMSSNYNAWKELWKIDKGYWLKLDAHSTICNDTVCYGKWEQFNITEIHTLCKYHILPVIIKGSYWTMRLNGDWLNPYTNQTYDVSDCDITDQGMICSLRTGHSNPCLTEEVGVCQWDHALPTDILFVVGPYTLCVTTMNPHPKLPYFPFSGCLQNVYIWTWGNRTYWLTNQTSTHGLTQVQWDVLHSNLGISLEKQAKLLRASTKLEDMAKQHLHNVTKLAINTVITSDQIAYLGKAIETTAHNSWWSIFEGWSPQARHLLNIFIHPIIVLLILFTLLTMFNMYIYCYIRRMRLRYVRSLVLR